MAWHRHMRTRDRRCARRKERKPRDDHTAAWRVAVGRLSTDRAPRLRADRYAHRPLRAVDIPYGI
jgi:hypothetical protein